MLQDAAVQIMLFGGCSTDHCAKGTDASKNSWRIDVGFENTTWEVETMPVGRVMPWSTLLPDGTMFVMGGAQNGESCISLPCMHRVKPPWQPGMRALACLSDATGSAAVQATLGAIPHSHSRRNQSPSRASTTRQHPLGSAGAPCWRTPRWPGCTTAASSCSRRARWAAPAWCRCSALQRAASACRAMHGGC